MNKRKTEILQNNLGLIALGIGFLLVPLFFKSFVVYEVSVALTYAIAILGLNILMGFNGQISVAHGVFFAIGAYTTAILTTRYGINPFLTIPVSVAIAGAFGLLVGIPALRWQGLPLAFITFGLAVITPPIALKLEPITKGAMGISFEKPTVPFGLGVSQDNYLYYLCVAGAVFCVIVARRLLSGNTGRALQAARDNDLIAESLGINLALTRLVAFTVSAAFAGFGGALFSLVNGYVSPESFQMTKSFDFLVGAIIGGITSVGGAFIGALFVILLPDWSSNISLAGAGIIYAVVLIVMMLVAKEGIVGLVKSFIRVVGTRLRLPGAQRVSLDQQKTTNV
jgi:branched-chain amino acid transport system permease protein